MELKELRLSDSKLFEQFLSSEEYHLSTYHFSNIFIWSSLFRIFYVHLDGYLCVFFKDKHSMFMYLPPLGRESEPAVIHSCFRIMDRFNNDRNKSRIENVQENRLAFYKKAGYPCFNKPGEYLYMREDIATLAGNRFKSKRASYNHFIKHYEFEFRTYYKQDMSGCLALYQHWKEERKNRFSDLVYQAMIEDNFPCQKLAMENFSRLGLVGYVIRIKDRITGYTLGFSINPMTFCILFEICDLEYKGISVLLFSEFCRRLTDYKYINVMDDSDLENLRKVKLSYHPVFIEPNYIIKNKDRA